jgi:hypothetical protein
MDLLFRVMANWRSINTAPSGKKLTVRLVLDGCEVYRGTAILQSADDPDSWIDSDSGKPIPRPTSWKAKGEGHPFDG